MIEYFSSEDHMISSQTDTHINMQLLVYFFLALVALSSAKQLKTGPQILSEEPSSKPSQNNDKRSVTQEFNLYFTPGKVQALQAVKSSQNSDSIETLKQNSGISEEFYNELIQKYYAENFKSAPIEEPQVESARSLLNFFLPREESVYNNKPNYRQLLMNLTKLSVYEQNKPKNRFNQFASPGVTDSAFYDLASGVNRNEDNKTSEKEIDYFLRNIQIDLPRQFNSPTQVRIQNSGRNMGQKKSAVEKEIENAWRQHQAFEFERSNSPADSRQSLSLSASNENPENTAGQKQIKYILRNGQAYGFERFNAPTEVNNQGSQGRNELRHDSEAKREIEKFWRKQQNSQFQRSFLRNESKEMSEVDKQIENIFIPQGFVYERLNSPPVVSNENPSGRNKNQDNTEAEKQIDWFFRNRQAKFEIEIAPEVNSESPLVADRNKSEVEKEIQNILKKHQDFEFRRSKSAAEAINQSPPIKIHEHVSIFKHVAVPVLKTVQVSVPTPVLVPIPQPYEVKVPRLYPVPLEVIKHVPVPVVKHY